MTMSKRKVLVFFVSAIFLTIFGIAFFRFSNFSFAHHWFQDTTMRGRAWAENIGDIWSNCSDYVLRFGGTCVDKHYESELIGNEVIAFNADVDSVTDIFSGWAWSNVGWITFDKEHTGDPYAGYLKPYLAIAVSTDPAYPLGSPSGTELRGWVQARSGAIDPLPLEPLPDWTEWIGLNCKDYEDAGFAGTCAATDNFKVTWNPATRELHGWAWGGGLVGWISFNCEEYQNLPGETRTCVNKTPEDPTLNPVTELADYAVIAKINQAPYVSNMSVTKFYTDVNNECYAPPYHHFAWQFNDADDVSTQTAYEIQVSPYSDFSLIAASQTYLAINVQTRNFEVDVSPGVNELAYNTTYYWRVKVYDSGQVLDSAGNGSKNSGWWYPSASAPGGATLTSPGDSFATEKHVYPTATFTFSPKKPSKGEEVRFKENATCYKHDGAPDVIGPCPRPAEGPDPAVDCPLGSPDTCYAWDFDYIAPSFAPDDFGRMATTTYDDTASHKVALRITDTDGYACISEPDEQKTITPQLPLPKFRETAPSGLEKARDYTASVIDKSALDFKKIIFK